MIMNKTRNLKPKKELGYQIIFWVALFLFGVAKNYGEHDHLNFKALFYYDLCHWIFQIIGANFIYFVLIRKYFDSKRYTLFFIYLFVSLYILGVLNRIFIVYAAEPFFADYPKDSIADIFSDIKYLLFHYIFTIISGSFIFVSIMFILRYKNEKHSRLQIQKEKTELELKVLKSQLNPHFLFNTLNNIYSLAISNSAATAQSISRLSDILDYVLARGQEKMVSAAEELKIIKDYVELEKLRYDERLTVNQSENIEFPAFIPPLLYLSLVENAFKHGAEKTSGDIEINISLFTDRNFATFKVENHFYEKAADERIGIGLNNIKKQLELYYTDRHSLEIEKFGNRFSVKLTTPLHYDQLYNHRR